MNKSKRYSPEARERAVRMVLEQRKEHNKALQHALDPVLAVFRTAVLKLK